MSNIKLYDEAEIVEMTSAEFRADSSKAFAATKAGKRVVVKDEDGSVRMRMSPEINDDKEDTEISIGDIVQAHNGLGPCEIIEGPLYRMKSIASSPTYCLGLNQFHLIKKKAKENS